MVASSESWLGYCWLSISESVRQWCLWWTLRIKWFYAKVTLQSQGKNPKLYLGICTHFFFNIEISIFFLFLCPSVFASVKSHLEIVLPILSLEMAHGKLVVLNSHFPLKSSWRNLSSHFQWLQICTPITMFSFDAQIFFKYYYLLGVPNPVLSITGIV